MSEKLVPKEYEEMLAEKEYNHSRKEFYDYLYSIVEGKVNNLGEKKAKIINNIFSKEERDYFIQDKELPISNTKKEGQKITFSYLNKKRLIRLILDLEINQLDQIEKIYNFNGYPFNYEDNKLSDLYDEVLKFYVKEVIKNEELVDTYANEQGMKSEKFDKPNTNNQKFKDKYTIVFTYYIKEWIEQNKTGISEFDKFINKLFLELYFLDDNEFEYIIFPQKELEELSIVYDSYSSVYGTDKKVTFEQYRMVVLCGLIKDILGEKTKNKFRSIIGDSDKSYVLQMLFDRLNDETDFSFNTLYTNHANFFIANELMPNRKKPNQYVVSVEDQNDRHNLFIEYFTRTLGNVVNQFQYFPWLKRITKKELKQIVINYKETVDEYVIN